MRTELLETPARHGWFLRVEFILHVDRYRHVISAVDPNGVATPLLESLEGSPADDCPPSPPLQSLHIETPPDGRRVALLVGMAGKSHWSASVEADSERLTFDVACRAAQANSQMGSHYQLARDIQPRDAAGAISLPFGEVSLTLAGSKENGTQTLLHATPTSVIIAPQSVPGRHPTPTHRWLYRITLSDPRT